MIVKLTISQAIVGRAHWHDCHDWCCRRPPDNRPQVVLGSLQCSDQDVLEERVVDMCGILTH